MDNHRKITEKSISEPLSEIWAQLTRNQRRFVIAMQEHTTKKDAALAIGLEADTVYRWNGIVDDAIELLSQDITTAAYAIIESYGVKAAMVKATGLDSDRENTRQYSATEILDRVLGKPTQRSELTGADGEELNIRFTWVGDNDND